MNFILRNLIKPFRSSTRLGKTAKQSVPKRQKRGSNLPLSGAFICCFSGLVFASTITESPTWVVSLRKAQVKNPIELNDVVLVRGLALYEEHCISCHGSSGHGDGTKAGELEVESTDLTLPDMWAQTDGELFYKLSKGRKPMPGYKRQMSEKERWRVVHYMRSIAPKPDVVPARFHASEEQREAISEVFRAYKTIHNALVDNDIDQAHGAVGGVSSSVTALLDSDSSKMPKDIGKVWQDGINKLASSAKSLTAEEDSEKFRKVFGDFSMWLADFMRQFGHAQSNPLKLYSAEFQDESTRFWLQENDTPANPYSTSFPNSKTTILRKLGSLSSREP